MKEFRLLAIIICVLQSLDFLETICTHPFGTGTYISSTRGTLTTTDTTIANYKFTAGTFRTTITLTCYNQYDSNRYIFFHYYQLFIRVWLNLYTCLDIRNSTYSDKYYFYEATEFDNSGGDYFTADSTDVCNRVSYLTAVETNVVIKKDTYDTNKIYCPNIILGNYTYNSTDDYSDMDSCNNTQQLTFKKNKTTYVALSRGGNLKCMYSGTGTYVYLITFNIDTSVDNSNTYQFTCFAFSFSGYGSVVYASQRPQSCSSSQTPTSADSTAGKTFIFTPYVTCPVIETSTDSKAAEDVTIISSSQTPTSADSTAGKTSIFTPYAVFETSTDSKATEDFTIISSSQTLTSADSTAGKTSIFTPYAVIETSTDIKAADDVTIISSSQTPTSADSIAGKTSIFTPYAVIETSTDSKVAEDVTIISSSQTPTSADSIAGKTSIFTPYAIIETSTDSKAAEDVTIISSSQTPTSADSTAGKTSIFTPYAIIETSTESIATEDLDWVAGLVDIISSSQTPTSADSTAGKTSIFTPYAVTVTSTESKATEDIGWFAGLVAIIVLVIITVIVIAYFIFKKDKVSDNEPIIKQEEGRDGTPTPSPPPSLDRCMMQFDLRIETPSVQSFKGRNDKVEDKNVGGGEPLLEEDEVINCISGEPLPEDKEVINSIHRDTLPEDKEVAKMRGGEPILKDGDDKLKEDIEIKSFAGDEIPQDNILEPGKRINEEVEEEEIPTPDTGHIRRLQHDNSMHNSGSNTGNNTNRSGHSPAKQRENTIIDTSQS